MRDEPIRLPFHAAGRGLALAGLRLAYGLAVVLLTAVRVLVVVLLRLVQPFPDAAASAGDGRRGRDRSCVCMGTALA